MSRQQTVQESQQVISTFGRVMIELGPILNKVEHKSRYGNEKEKEDADALFHEYLKCRKLDMEKDLDGETIYALAERFINFEAADERQEKEEDYDIAA
ncbi:MAG: hypothetical protein QXD77_02840 [Candidatus Aenigmatarchaeota archaeon]